MLLLTPHTMALASAVFSAVATMLIQQGLRRSNFYAGFWVNVVVGAAGLWAAVLFLVQREDYHWSAVPYFVLSGVVGTAAGRLFRVAGIEKVGAPVAASINNLSPFISTGLAILVLEERMTLPILMGTLVIVLGAILLSLSGKQVGFRVRHLVYPFLSASCFGVVAVIRKLGLGHAGPLLAPPSTPLPRWSRRPRSSSPLEIGVRWCAMDGVCSILSEVVSRRILVSSWCCWHWALGR